MIHWSPSFPLAMGYVMLGRCQTINDLFICGDFDPYKIKCNEASLLEAQRIDGISAERLQKRKELEDMSLIVSYINGRSMREHYADIILDPYLMKSHILGVGETWLHEEEEVCIKDFTGSFINSGRGKGLAVFHKGKLETEQLKTNRSSIIITRHNLVDVIFMYLSQDFDWEEVEDFLEKVICFEKPCIVLGDMNWHYPDHHPMKEFFIKN